MLNNEQAQKMCVKLCVGVWATTGQLETYPIMTDGQSGTNRAFILGLDGVPWTKLNSWIDDGHLPNFERLRDSGAAGPLESTMPPTTALAWPSIATGVKPDKHGVYGFQNLHSDYSHQINTSADVDHPTLWDQLSPAVVANVPMTYPAPSIDGELVAGMMAPEMNEQFTHPTALRDEITEAIPDYEIGLTWSEYTDRNDAFLEDLDALVNARRDLMELLMDREDWRLFFFVYTAPDRLQHLLWDEDVLVDHYQLLDDVLGDVMAYVEERDANLFVVSDHGFGPTDRYVALNSALERDGYLERRESGGVRNVFSNLGVRKADVLSALGAVGIDEQTLVTLLPNQFLDSVAKQIPGSHVLFDVDFERTRAFVHGPGCVYVNDSARFEHGVVDPADRIAVKTEIADVFSSITDPDTGEPVLDVYDGDDLFENDAASPDLIVCPPHSYKKVQTLRDDVIGPLTGAEGGHRREGVFFAWGPSIADAEPEGANVVDVAPTLLHSVGEPVPSSLDGAVLTDVLIDDIPVTTRSITATDGSEDATNDEDFADVEDRLRGLGYMS